MAWGAGTWGFASGSVEAATRSSDLTSAAVADLQVLEMASPALAADARASRRNYMDDHLALALAADAPLIGLQNLCSF